MNHPKLKRNISVKEKLDSPPTEQISLVKDCHIKGDKWNTKFHKMNFQTEVLAINCNF